MASAAELKSTETTLRSRFFATRALTEALAAPLSDADATVQAVDDTSPTKWHLAHVNWFLETFVLVPMVSGYRRFDDRFDFLFNSYYEAVGARHPRARRGLLTRPTLGEILEWRGHVDMAIDRAWDRLSLAGLDLIELGIAHEQQHQELLLTDILYLFAQNPLEPSVYDDTPVHRSPLTAGWTRHDGGIYTIGHAGRGFAFDCEGPAYDVLLRPYALAGNAVTNADWAAFMADGGYRTSSLWLADGWAWLNREGVTAPLYWRDDDGGWSAFSLTGRNPIDPAAPVAHVSHYEADAFASWAGARLPTEAEWEVAATGTDPLGGNQLDGPTGIAPGGGNAGVFGDVWTWTASAFLPYPGFKAAEGAVGEYNGKFMSGQMVLRGASCATARGHSRASLRNFFYPHQRWQFTGLRLAKDV